MVQLSTTRCSCIAILWVSLVSSAAITLYVASQQVFIVASIYFVIISVRKRLDTPSYNTNTNTSEQVWRPRIVVFDLHTRGPHFEFWEGPVGIALSYGLDDRGPGVRLPTGAENFSLSHRVQDDSGAHPASYPMSTRGSFPGGKAAGSWSGPLTSIYCRGQRIHGAIPPLPNTLSWRGAQLKHRDFYLTSNVGTDIYMNKLKKLGVPEKCLAAETDIATVRNWDNCSSVRRFPKLP
jgi:hypothetical protein